MEYEVNDFGSGDNGGITSYPGSETPRETIFDDFNGDNGGADDIGGIDNQVANNSLNNTNNNNNPTANKAPDAYEPFNLPDNMDMNAPDVRDALSEAEGVFRELGLNQEQAQRLIDLHTKHWIGGAAEMEEQINTQLQAQIDEWGEQTKKDPEFGGARLNQSKMWVNRAISNLGGKSLLNALTKETGVINHPAVWRAFAKIGRDYFTEDKFIRNSNSGRIPDNSPLGMARRVYPNMK